MKRIFLHLGLLVISCPLFGTNNYSLSDCIRLAMTENVKVKQSKLDCDMADIALKGELLSFIPSLSVSNQENMSTGRALDPTTYQFVTNRTVFDMSTSIVGSISLFSGFERVNNTKKAKCNLQYALLDSDRTKNELALNITALFLNLVLDKETIVVCNHKILILQEYQDLIQKKIECEAATRSDLLNIQADITNAKVELMSALNDLNIDKVAMCEILGIDDWEHFDILAGGDDYEVVEPHLWCISDVISSANELPRIKQSELAVDIAKRDIRIAQSSFWPNVSLHAGYGSTFSNARTKAGGDKYNFREQFRDNMSSYVTLSLSVPISSVASVSNNVKQKRMACAFSELELRETKLTVDKEVKQAILKANTSYENYNLLATDVDKYEDALRQTREKYDAGVVTYYDYQTALSNLFQAEIKRLQSKYEYIFRTKIIEFYSGKSRY